MCKVQCFWHYLLHRCAEAVSQSAKDTVLIQESSLTLTPNPLQQQVVPECFPGILHPSSPDLHYSCHFLACHLSQIPCAHQLPMHRADVIVILNNIKFDMQCMVMQTGHKSESFQNSNDGKGSGKNSVVQGSRLFQGMAHCPEHVYTFILKLHSQLLSIHLWSNAVCPLNVLCRRFLKIYLECMTSSFSFHNAAGKWK